MKIKMVGTGSMVAKRNPACYLINDKIMIKNRAWQIQEEDNLSTPGISYFSLIGTTMSKEIINAENIKITIKLNSDYTAKEVIIKNNSGNEYNCDDESWWNGL